MSNAFKKRYELMDGRPRRIPTDKYAQISNERYKALLDADPTEREMQSFLEQHPWMVPVWRGSGRDLYPLHCGLIARPRLPGQKYYEPDFMWIGANSLTWFPTLIEIEKPGKKIFKQDGHTTQQFNDASGQLRQWRSWFDDPANVSQFVDKFGVPENFRRTTMELRLILIYGRRSEFESDPHLSKERGRLMRHGDELMSFDRLSADASMEDSITLKASGYGRYTAKWIPRVFDLGPGPLSSRLPFIKKIPDAIDRNSEICPERRKFLKERLPYWKNYANSNEHGLENLDDRE